MPTWGLGPAACTEVHTLLQCDASHDARSHSTVWDALSTPLLVTCSDCFMATAPSCSSVFACPLAPGFRTPSTHSPSRRAHRLSRSAVLFNCFGGGARGLSNPADLHDDTQAEDHFSVSSWWRVQGSASKCTG